MAPTATDAAPQPDVPQEVPAAGDEGAPASAEEDGQTAFNLRVELPQGNHVTLLAHPQDCVQDVRQCLGELPEAFHHSHFALLHQGTPLLDLTPLSTVPALAQTPTLVLKELEYTERAARAHVSRLQELLASPFKGTPWCPEPVLPSLGPAEPHEDGATDAPASSDYAVPLPPALPDLLPPPSQAAPAPCLRSLCYSGWNPPPSSRHLLGDFFYLDVVTVEGSSLCVTACAGGFYVNACTPGRFAPEKGTVGGKVAAASTLAGLLCKVSGHFLRGWEGTKARALDDSPYHSLPVPYPTASWVGREAGHDYNMARAQQALRPDMDMDEQIPGLGRDWNEDWQMLHSLPRATIAERLVRDRSLFRCHSEFVAAATKGAMAVVDGRASAINPQDAAACHMFIHNNIFFSHAEDGRDYYKTLGGTPAAHKAAAADLRGLQGVREAEPEGLHTLLTCLVDYRGRRVVAQSIIPGILRREQEEAVEYGSADGGNSIVTSSTFEAPMAAAAKRLYLKQHKVVDQQGKGHVLATSADCKGLRGNDRRLYVLDLFRVAPVDANFHEGRSDASSAFHGYSLHGLTLLRRELVLAFREAKYVTFLRQKMKDRMAQQAEQTEGGDEAAKSAGVELTDELLESPEFHFDWTYNPDTFTVTHARLPAEEREEDEALVRAMSKHVVDVAIPALVHELGRSEGQSVDVVGAGLGPLFHRAGINMRYLGHVAKALAQDTQPAQQRGRELVEGEMFVRGAKAVLRAVLRATPPTALAAATAHCLNCLLAPVQQAVQQPQPQAKKGAAKRKKQPKGPAQDQAGLIDTDSADYLQHTAETMWEAVSAEVKARFLYDLAPAVQGQMDRLWLLRRLCLAVGIQLRVRMLDWTGGQPLAASDIIQLLPRCKHLDPTTEDARALLEAGRQAMQHGHTAQAEERLREALAVCHQVYGPLHPDVATCFMLLGAVSGAGASDGQEGQEGAKERDDAAMLQYRCRAVVVAERTLGLDHPTTAAAYMAAGEGCLSTGRPSTAYRYLSRGRMLAQLLAGPNTLDMLQADMTLGLVLAAAQQGELAERHAECVLQAAAKMGTSGGDLAQIHRAQVHMYATLGDFKRAMRAEKLANALYRAAGPEADDRVKESDRILEGLTQRAVQARTMEVRGAAANGTGSGRKQAEAKGGRRTKRAASERYSTRRVSYGQGEVAGQRQSITEILNYINS